MKARATSAAVLAVALCAAGLSGCQHSDSSEAESSPSTHPSPIERTAPTGPSGAQVDTIEAAYTAQIRNKVQQLSTETHQTMDAFTAGGGQDRYVATHTLYMQLQPTAKRFEPTRFAIVNLDRLLNERESDYQLLDPTDTRKWMGWHQIEKDLWQDSQADRATHAANLIEQTELFSQLVNATEFSVSISQICKDTTELLEEAAIREATGQEEQFSHTDIDDLNATIGQAKAAYTAVRPLIRDKSVISELDKEFDATQQLIDTYRSGNGFALYTSLSDAQRRELVDRVSTLRHSVGKLTDAVLTQDPGSASPRKSTATPSGNATGKSHEGGKR
ncbi:MAG: EfeM/EfeO family lipoprotein [Actinomycetaceae bacterium]|nr:EfeM/EfeO family lipoprotein [Actinomycetaceae bacterium]MDU0970109.1 EfeM/EfeO family lipoprotein [Actinomycetaceae bacterium]